MSNSIFYSKKRLQGRCLAGLITIMPVLSAALLATGCSTAKVHVYDHDILHPYLGTKTATRLFVRSFSEYSYYGQPFLMAMDIPLCLVTDTVLFPYDLIVRAKRHSRAEHE